MTDHELEEPIQKVDPADVRSPFPGAAPTHLLWERHDRTHLEIVLQYPASADGTPGEHGWDAYYFLPETFRLDASSYEKRELFSDLRSYVRFSVPPLELDAVPDEAGTLAGRLLTESLDAGIDDLKLFASRVRRAISGGAREIDNAVAAGAWDDVPGLVHGFVASGNAALAAVRDVMSRWKLRGVSFQQADPELAKAAAWVDEHLSRLLEIALVEMAAKIEGAGGPDELLGVTGEAAVDEARYRRRRRAGPVSSVDGSVHDLERIERRHHSLKRYTSSVLWLDVEVRDGYSGAQHAFHALAAGVAMAFAVVVAVLWGQPGTTSRLGMWAAVVIVAYMGKDRLKAMLQSVFDSLIMKHLPDRRWTVRSPGTSVVLADVTERARFIDRDDLPEDVETARSVSYRDRLEELAGPESVLHHSKTVHVHSDAMATSAPEFQSLTDVMRIDVSRWLAHTDDAKRTVTLADPEAGELFRSKLPRAYDVTVVYRLTNGASPAAPWNVARIVVSRNGIRRVGPPNPPPR